MKATDHRVLLIEFVNADQSPGRVNYQFPFMRGYLDKLGVPTRWIRFGISTINLLRHQRDQITLSHEELAKLKDVFTQHDPTVVVITDSLYEPQKEFLTKNSSCIWLQIAKDLALNRVPEFSDYSGYWLLDRDHFMPRYDWEPGNAEATRKNIDNIYIALGGSCGHRMKVAENPMFKGLNDPRVNTRLGCTFCENWINVSKPLTETPLEWITKQVHGIAKSRGASGNFPNGLLLERVDNLKIFQRCIEAIEETGMVGRVELLFAVRTNMVSHLEGILKRYLERHPTEGVKFGVYACGIESFSETDLLRFNKGAKPLDSFRAIIVFNDLSMNYPERFKYSGLTFILFTPWTTMETLHLNIGLIRFFKLTFKGASIFQSRLRLHPEISITALAEREGLVVDEETDPFLVMNRRKLFNIEIPWRFKDPRLKPLSRIVLRCEFLGSDMADNLTRRIEECLNRFEPHWRAGYDSKLIEFIYAMIDVAREASEPVDEEILLEKGLELLRRRVAEKEAPPKKHRHRIGTRRVELTELLKRLAPLLQAGLKPLLSIENVTLQEAANAEIESLIKRMGIRTHFMRSFSIGKRDVSGDLLCAIDEKRLMRLVAAREAMLNVRNGKDFSEAVIKIGNLYGYPECCVRAYVSGKFSYIGVERWALFLRRNEIRGEILQEINPFLVPALMFVPCSLDCHEAARLYKLWFNALKPFQENCIGDDVAYIFSFDEEEEAEFVPLRVLNFHDEGIVYTIDNKRGDKKSRKMERLCSGNRIRIIPGQIQVFRDEQILDLMTASHGLWFHRRCWHPDEWNELALAAAQNAQRKIPFVYKEKLSFRNGRDTDSDRILVLMGKILRRFPDHFKELSVLEIKKFPGDSRFHMRVSINQRDFLLFLSRKDAVRDSLFQTENFAITYSRDTPLASQRDQKIIYNFVRMLDRLIVRHAPELLNDRSKAE